MARLLPVLFLLITVLLLYLLVRDRLRERQRLVEDWVIAGRPGSRGAFVRRGLRAYDRARRSWRYGALYLVPICVISTLLYITNFK